MNQRLFASKASLTSVVVALGLLASLPVLSRIAAQDQKEDSAARLFEMLEYEAEDKMFDELVQQFGKDVKAIEKHGATIVGCWSRPERRTSSSSSSSTTSTSVNGTSSSKSSQSSSQSNTEGGTLVCLLAFADKEARDAFWTAVAKDADCIVPNRATNKNLVDDVDSQLLAPTDYSPLR